MHPAQVNTTVTDWGLPEETSQREEGNEDVSADGGEFDNHPLYALS